MEDELIYKIQYNYDFRLLISTLNLYSYLKDTTPKRTLIFNTLIQKINDKLDNSKAEMDELVELVNSF